MYEGYNLNERNRNLNILLNQMRDVGFEINLILRDAKILDIEVKGDRKSTTVWSVLVENPIVILMNPKWKDLVQEFEKVYIELIVIKAEMISSHYEFPPARVRPLEGI